MQKKIIALAVAALASSAAFAQTNVTVYGVVDAGVAYMKATDLKGQFAVESGMLGGSRIGFKGTEDLGNGLKALFTLEYGLAVDENLGVGAADQAGTFAGTSTAAKNTNWGSSLARQQFVGLSGNFGTAVVGRLQTAGYDFACAYNPVAGGALDAAGKLGAATLLACGTTGRADNAIAYISPSFGGVTVALNHARISEAAVLNGAKTGGEEKDNSATLIGVTYANGPLQVGGVYSKISMAGTTAEDSTREYGIGASYDFGVVKVMGLFQSQKTDEAKTGYDGSDRKFALSAVAPVGKGAIVASYARNKLKNTTDGEDTTSSAYTLAYLHSLSKRTTLYAGWNHVSNQDLASKGIVGSDTAGTTLSSGYAASTPALDTVGYVPSAGGSANVFGAGINHKF